MGKNNALKGALALVVAVVVIYLAYDNGYIGGTGTTASVTPGVPSTPTTSVPGTTQLSGGDLVTLTVSPVDQLASAALTEATNVKHQWLLRNTDGSFTFQIAGTSKTINVSSDGKVWAALETQASGQSYVFSPKYTALTESRFNNDCTYMDFDHDGTKEYVCSFHTVGLTPQVQNFGTIPTMNLNTKWLNENVITSSAPADVSSIGTTAGTAKFTQYTLTGTAGDATLLTRIQVVMNSTSDSKWSAGDSYVKFTNLGITKSLSEFKKSQDGTNTTYECLLDSNLNCAASTEYRINNAYALEFPSNGGGTTQIEEKIVWNLATSDVIAVTTKWDGVNEIDGATTQVTDLVNYSA